MKYAKLISIVTACALMSTTMLTGCKMVTEEKIVVDTTKNTVEVNLEATSNTASIISIEKEKTQETEEETPAAAEIVSALTGDETVSEKKVLYEAKVYNQPSTESSVLGTVAADTMITVLGQTSNSLWYKISFNGRVCYMRATEFEKTPVKKTETKKPVKSSESQKPVKPSESQKPVKPSESQKPEPSESQKPESSESQKPESSESQKPEPSESQKPESSESQKPEPSESQKPESSESQKPESSESQKPEPSESQKPEPSESQKPEPSESQKAEPANPVPSDPGEEGATAQMLNN